ncbi:DUF2256 domain-containing protein [Synechococcus sp. HB1133]|uniref:DUF2256 domain-containing protein n=1 Tax=unclassified Synechococcus TaxID=2626047 RepID=UPI000E0E3886|nr:MULTISPECIES: DUF2256 domain-containing protein [unclassified Synechococcus]MCB4376868.1 DUF2256 domain-containing protein [Synechococcus sp. MU1650]MCB4395039.1 DUF2256 domain-containing protein [Synechococcus sp. PH41509]MCB4398995.1 DUF2256 domain-containing protein [Synechococcus sp. MU1625]MCB4410800.1 DUF2256 domain-containing protein [Synechococcus sp. MU1611]MCB4421939.1 DUF2256 domain-containing protein [Synechococcus sp. HB1133]
MKRGGSKNGGLKNNRPSKICPVCARPFEWRKAWRNCWDDVVYCSDRCRRRKNKSNP